MKAYKLLGTNANIAPARDNTNNSNDDDSTICLFRPDMNMKRLQKSMERLQMPGSDFDHEELIKCIAKLVELDKKWIPSGEGYSLYIRPTVIATQRFLGLAAADSLLLYVITTPVGPYYKSGFKPVRLTADTPYVRAWPGGTGDCKVGGNYAPTMKAQVEAMKAGGYSQVLWLFHDSDTGEDTITEVGAMNVFFVIANKQTGRPELVTPPLTRGDILPGVTRDSILYLARHKWGKGSNDSGNEIMDVSERFPAMSELVQAAEEGRLLEAFGAGTAAVVTPISAIQYRGKDIDIPATGPVTQRIWDDVTGIQYGKIPGPDGWCVPVS
jgi:branched-chain amino acid aminotransferase